MILAPWLFDNVGNSPGYEKRGRTAITTPSSRPINYSPKVQHAPNEFVLVDDHSHRFLRPRPRKKTRT